MGGGSPWLVAEAVGLLVAVYVPAFAIASLGFAFVKSRVPQTEESLQITALPMFLTIGVSLGMALLLTAIVSHGNFAAFGFQGAPARAIWQSSLLGILFGVALATLAFLLRTRLPFVEALPRWQLVLLAWIATPFQEEVIFRGLFQGILERASLGDVHVGGWTISVAAVIAAVVFALVHLNLRTTGATWSTAIFTVIGALILGLLAGYFRWQTGSLIPCFIVHALFNMPGTLADWIKLGER
jgi:membrane protease YdiL (CAAX protease family)